MWRGERFNKFLQDVFSEIGTGAFGVGVLYCTFAVNESNSRFTDSSCTLIYRVSFVSALHTQSALVRTVTAFAVRGLFLVLSGTSRPLPWLYYTCTFLVWSLEVERLPYCAFIHILTISVVSESISLPVFSCCIVLYCTIQYYCTLVRRMYCISVKLPYVLYCRSAPLDQYTMKIVRLLRQFSFLVSHPTCRNRSSYSSIQYGTVLYSSVQYCISDMLLLLLSWLRFLLHFFSVVRHMLFLP